MISSLRRVAVGGAGSAKHIIALKLTKRATTPLLKRHAFSGTTEVSKRRAHSVHLKGVATLTEATAVGGIALHTQAICSSLSGGDVDVNGVEIGRPTSLNILNRQTIRIVEGAHDQRIPQLNGTFNGEALVARHLKTHHINITWAALALHNLRERQVSARADQASLIEGVVTSVKLKGVIKTHPFASLRVVDLKVIICS
jgi:hypothetical protein